jgi:hypothetical protein
MAPDESSLVDCGLSVFSVCQGGADSDSDRATRLRMFRLSELTDELEFRVDRANRSGAL